MLKEIKISILMTLLLTLLTGFIYPLLVTVLAQVIFPSQANGSLIKVGDKVIGSKLIGQNFTSEKYFHPRPSESNYDGLKSGGSNLGPTSKKLIKKVNLLSDKLKAENPNLQIPSDLVTASASGLDPHISPGTAIFQAQRIAHIRGINQQKLLDLIEKYTEKKLFGVFGEKRVNVLLLNLALDTL